MSAQPVVPSPCKDVCLMNEKSGYCRGCWRTLAEIAGWGDFSAERKAAILRELAERRRTHEDRV